MADGWKPRTARRFTVYKNCPLPTPEDRVLFILVYLKTYALQVVHGRLFGMVQGKANQWIHVLLPALLAALRTLGDAPARSLTALAQRLGVSEAAAVSVPLAEAPPPSAPVAGPTSPLAHDGTERRIVRPQDPPAQTDCYSGKKKDHTLKNVLLVNALLVILFLSDTHGAVSMICASRRPPPPTSSREWVVAGSGLPVIHAPAGRNPYADEEATRCGADLEQQRANQVLNQRRLRIEHVNSSVKRCRIVKDRIRLWKAGVRDLVMELCCAPFTISGCA